jgi:N-acetylmuramoyl-L-alanine amidase
MITIRYNFRKYILWFTFFMLAAAGAGLAAGQEDAAFEGEPLRTIVIDAGHGGHNKGAVGTGGTAEKDVTLTLAMLTADDLGSRYRVVLTRTGDYQVEPVDRIAMANNARADLFISLHVGGSFSMQQSGVAIFFLPAEFEEVENALGLAASADPDTRSFVLWDEAHFTPYRLSRAFANQMERSCKEVFGDECRVKNDPVAVLEGLNLPAIMMEIGCLANPVWEDRLRNPDHLKAIAEMIAGAIDRYFQPDPDIEETLID